MSGCAYRSHSHKYLFFFFSSRRRHTRLQGDWSSDVCSSDLRAASLTRQLLMFSRKNVMQPAMLDLREVVVNMSKMLKRLLGENIDLQFNPPQIGRASCRERV